MRFAIVGVGGVGGYLGGLLAHAGIDVTFVTRPESVQALRATGIVLKTVKGEFVLPEVKVSSPEELTDVDVICLTTKTYDLETSVKALPEKLKRSATIITFQNGIEHDKFVKKVAPTAQVYPGVVYIISTKTAPGVIEQTGGPCTFFIGDRNSPHNERLLQIASAIKNAGVNITYLADIERELWAKFIWIIALAGTTGANQSSIGPIVNDPEKFSVFMRCIDESIAVAKALGINIGEAERKVSEEKAIAYRTKGGEAKASLAVDLERGRVTEVEALHGTVVRLAKELGVPVPTVEDLYRKILARTKSSLS